MKKKIVITGATSGIGLQTAKDLLNEKHKLILANRNQEKAENVRKELLDLYPMADIDLLELDLSSFESIKNCAENIRKTYNTIDILINNAGLFMDTKKYTREGFEMTMGVNYLGTYLFTELLTPCMNNSTTSKIIFVSSAASYFGRLWLRKDFFVKHSHGFLAYSDSKLALMIYVKYLADKLQNTSVVVKAVHPGDIYTGIWKGETKLMDMAAKRKRKNSRPIEEGSYMGVLLTLKDKYDTTDCLFYRYDEKPMKLPKKARKPSFVNRFIKYTEEVIESINI